MTSRITALAHTIDEKTPETRNRVVDFLRAAAITVVVIGHWTLVAVHPEHGIQPHGVLDRAAWTHPLTWVFQIMPIFFLVGGFSNGLSWRSARRKGHSYSFWLRARVRRLTGPLIPVLLTWLTIAIAAWVFGADAATMKLASGMALIPTWFLAAYLMVIVVAPGCLVLWERFGWFSIAGGVLLAGLVDLVSISTDSVLAGYPNYLLVWASFHQVGYAWLDGRLAAWRSRIILFVIGAVGLVLLVGLGPYPVSMITAHTDAISNSNPSRVTMAFLGMMQAAVVLSLEPALRRALANKVLWLVTVLVNKRIMTWFLWHLTAMVAVAHLLLATWPALLPTPLTGTWWATRPLWWLILLGVTGVLVLIYGLFEDVAADVRPAPAPWRPVVAAVAVIAGLGLIANVGVVGSSLLSWVAVALVALGPVATGMFAPGRASEHDRRG